MSTTMQIESRELNPCTIELSIKCGPEQVKTGYSKAFRAASKHIRVPGFRPGAAPEAIMRNYVNEEEVRRVAAERIIRDAFAQAVKQEDLKPYGQPSIDIVKFDEAECEFTAKVPLEPKVELGDYENLAAVRPSVEVTDEEVEEWIQHQRQRQAKQKKVEGRGAQDGDIAVVQIKPEGTEGDGRRFMTVVGDTFPQLDQALRGMKAEETKIVDLTFPEGFQEADWAGKPMKCDVLLRSLAAPELPDLGEDFAKRFEAESVDELRAMIREGIGRAKARSAEEYVNDQIRDQLMQRSTVHVPDTMWEGVAQRRMEGLAEDAQKEGQTMADVAERNNMTLEELRERLKEQAHKEVQWAALIQEIYKKEELTVANSDLNDQLQVMAMEYETEPQALFAALKRTGNLDELQYRAMHARTLSKLREKTTISEAPPE